MTNLKEVRKRIRSTESVKQITKAMEMVSAARLRRAQNRVIAARHYDESLKSMLAPLASQDISHPLLEAREPKKVGVVVVAGEKGLCGSFNAAIFHETDAFLKSYRADQIELILVGVKAIEYYQRSVWNILMVREMPLSKMPYSQMKSFGDSLIEDFLSRELDEIYFIYTQFLSASSRPIKKERFLSLEKSRFQSGDSTENYLFEPAPNEVANRLLPVYCQSRVHSVLLESYAAELSARVEAMRMATRNAGDMIERLTLERNKVRQASITKEILEIALGAEGVNQ